MGCGMGKQPIELEARPLSIRLKMVIDHFTDDAGLITLELVQAMFKDRRVAFWFEGVGIYLSTLDGIVMTSPGRGLTVDELVTWLMELNLDLSMLEKDPQTVIQQQMKRHKRLMNQLEAKFREMDYDRDGMVSVERLSLESAWLEGFGIKDPYLIDKGDGIISLNDLVSGITDSLAAARAARIIHVTVISHQEHCLLVCMDPSGDKLCTLIYEATENVASLRCRIAQALSKTSSSLKPGQDILLMVVEGSSMRSMRICEPVSNCLQSSLQLA